MLGRYDVGEAMENLAWLQTSVSDPSPTLSPGQILKEYRAVHGYSQRELAAILQISQPQMSKLENEIKSITDIKELRRIAAVLDLPPALLAARNQHKPVDGRTLPEVFGRVGESQRAWVRTRSVLNQQRSALAQQAARLYPKATQLTGPVLTAPHWLPLQPTDIRHLNIALETSIPARPPWDPGVISPAHPAYNETSRFERYSRAVRDLARPTLFENRPCYRPLAIDLHERTTELSFTNGTYFEAVDICEAVAHEFAAVLASHEGALPHMDELPLRSAVGDPFNLDSRSSCMSINTLTIRDACPTPSFYMHQRNSAAVAVAGGMLHVVPAGVFQPATVNSAYVASDFSLWNNMMREYAEELLGLSEYDGDAGMPIAYESGFFGAMTDALNDGRLRVYCLGAVIEPLTLWVELQTVACFESTTFDHLFKELVASNDEGLLATADRRRLLAGIPFNEKYLSKMTAGSVSGVSHNLLNLAWRHRASLVRT